MAWKQLIIIVIFVYVTIVIFFITMQESNVSILKTHGCKFHSVIAQVVLQIQPVEHQLFQR